MAPITVRSDLVIGIDFGMTATGVAYCTPPWSNVKTFQQWTSLVYDLANKVPSRVAYLYPTESVHGWGFNANFADPDSDIREYFKLYLDPDYRDDFDSISNAEAKRHYRDYLRKLHDHIVQWFSPRFPNFFHDTVEFAFSVPTTWHNPAMINDLENLIREAGFGRDGPRHLARITLTEAEAAAISVAAEYVSRDDVVVICDAGGGTTDVNILKLLSDRGQPIRLQQLSRVEGKAVGSALIDIRVQAYLEKRLEVIADRLPAPPSDTAERMMEGRFERFKCTFGTPAGNLPALLLDVPGLGPGTNVDRAEIVNSRIAISREYLKQLFDEQVDSMTQLLTQQLVSLQTVAPNERCSYLILSGGLGSSQYVRDQLTEYFQTGPGRTLSNTGNMRLLLAENPQLAVVLGLVMDRAQELGRSTQAIARRIARVNYGVVVNYRYDPKKHKGLQPVKDPRDGKKWILNQVEWLIKEGDLVDDQGVVKHVRAKLQRVQLTRPWKAQFVLSNENRNMLSQDANSSSVKTLCVVEADLRYIERIPKNQHWWQLGMAHELADFDLRVVAGSADLSFQLWNNGRMLTGEYESIAVDWNSGKPIRQDTEFFSGK